MIQEELTALVNLGLNESEAKVYLDLQTHKESQTGGICERTNVRSSHIYSILNVLLNKGLISYKIVNNVKIYSSLGPENLAYLFEEKEERIKQEKKKMLELISNLTVTTQKSNRLTDFKYFSGIRGIKSMFTEVMNLWSKEDDYYVVAVTEKSFEILEPFFLDFHKKRVKDKVSLKIIIDEKAKKWGRVRERMPKTEVKYLDIGATTEYGVLNDYLFLASYGDEPYSLLIKDKNFAETYKSFFNILWSVARE